MALSGSICSLTLSVFWLAAGISAAAGQPLQATPLACGSGLFPAGGDPAENISGIDCIETASGHYRCVAVADEGVSITTLSLNYLPGSIDPTCTPGAPVDLPVAAGCLTVEPYDKNFCFSKPPKMKEGKLERDFEGVSIDANGITATGSWGMARKKGVLRPGNWTFVRANETAGASTCTAANSNALRTALAAIGDDAITSKIDHTLQCGGLNIEGFEQVHGIDYFGLRSPSNFEGGGAYVVAVSDGDLLTPGSSPAAPAANVYKILFKNADGPIRGIGIRGIDFVDDGFILLTGDAGVDEEEEAVVPSRSAKCGCADLNEGHPNVSMNLPPELWFWREGDAEAQSLGQLEGVYEHVKAEGVTAVHQTGRTVDLILAIDSSTTQTGQLAVIHDVPLPR